MATEDLNSRFAELEGLFAQGSALTGADRRGFLEDIRERDADMAIELEELFAAEDQPDARFSPASISVDTILDELGESAPTLAGKTVGQFLLADVLGGGGMATVYRGRRIGADFEQAVAMKLLKKGLLTNEDRARFRRERQILANLEHPSIARLIDGGVTEEGRPYLALELIKGRPIDVYCSEESLDVQARVRLIIEVGSALHYAHQRRIIHRDLKPSNVLVDALLESRTASRQEGRGRFRSIPTRSPAFPAAHRQVPPSPRGS